MIQWYSIIVRVQYCNNRVHGQVKQMYKVSLAAPKTVRSGRS
jgi:hypothetical protein